MRRVEASSHRVRWLKIGLRLETLSLLWVSLEAVLGGYAAWQVGSLAISTFSVDSAIELLSGVVLLIRLALELRLKERQLPDWMERAASAVVSLCLFTLAGFIAFESGQTFAARVGPEFSVLGLVIAALSSLITPWLAMQKRRIGLLLDSHALLGDAACSMTCAYMAWTLLAGLLCQWLFGWWWVDSLAALGILYFVTREAWEAASAAWTGKAHVHQHGA